jgi:phosphate starvation-inducible PhoH-like protein
MAKSYPKETKTKEAKQNHKGAKKPKVSKIEPKTENQSTYLKNIEANTITICVGPAGTGKTYIAMNLAIYYLLNKRVNRIILVRPVVESGEKLGFLPGDIAQKLDPYVRPLYDALYDMVGAEEADKLLNGTTIEIAPLAYMRGRTLSNAFIILDEAQNATKDQMKMFLTRLGENSKMVITGDTSQVDIKEKSGLVDFIEKIKGKEIQDLNITTMGNVDIVRSKIVGAIVNLYESYSRNYSTYVK